MGVPMTRICGIDLFCGAGGLTHGLIAEGLNVVAGVDLDNACKYPYESNNKATFIKKDVARLTKDQLETLFGRSEVKVLAGCAPCQPFSTYSHRYDISKSPKWGLLYHFSRLIKGTSADIVTMENVPSVVKHAVFDDFLISLEKLGYHVFHDVVDCSRYGLPQGRKRLVLLASRLGPIEIINPKKRRVRTVRDAIGRLPFLLHGETDPEDPLHSASRLSDLNLERIRASVPGGTWRTWPPHLIADCHKRETGRTYPGVYGRMSWDEPSPTLTTQFFGFGNGRYGHPEQDRAISLREGAILQGFPRSYSFTSPRSSIHFKELGRLIGNAVPVTLGRILGQSIFEHLKVSPRPQKIERESITARRRPIALPSR
jgi:DNA (cytosine-5)-methyltransferase 1